MKCNRNLWQTTNCLPGIEVKFYNYIIIIIIFEFLMIFLCFIQHYLFFDSKLVFYYLNMHLLVMLETVEPIFEVARSKYDSIASTSSIVIVVNNLT